MKLQSESLVRNILFQRAYGDWLNAIVTGENVALIPCIANAGTYKTFTYEQWVFITI